MAKKVQLFITCLMDTFRPTAGEAVVRVLNRLGVEVHFPPDQTCCGQPAFNAGMRDEARKMAKHTITAFENQPGDIIIPSGSCTSMVRHYYPELFVDDTGWKTRAENLASRTFDFTEYLVDALGVTDVGAHYQGKLTYHASCHLSRGLGIDQQPMVLLNNIHGATITELPEVNECCGFGGVFSVKHPLISAEMLKRKIDNIESTGAPITVMSDTGCLLHVSGGLHRQGKPQKIVYIAEVLANMVLEEGQ